MTSTDKNGTTLKNRIKPSTQIEDFTDDELVDLTPTEVDYYIDLECARTGVPLLPPHPGEAPDKPSPVLDVELHEVKLGYTSVLTCKDADDALDIANVLKNVVAKGGAVHTAEIGGYGAGIGQCLNGQDARDVEIKAIGAASEASKLESEKAVQSYKTLKSRHDEQMKEYRAAKEGREQIEEDVREAIEEAGRRVRRRQRAQERLDRYIELAAGNRAMALRFLEAHSRDDVNALGLEDEVRALTVPEELDEDVDG